MPVAAPRRRGSKSAPPAASPQFVRAAIRSEHGVEIGRKRKHYRAKFGAVSKLIWFALIVSVAGGLGYLVYHTMADNAGGHSSSSTGPQAMSLVRDEGIAVIMPPAGKQAYRGTLLGHGVQGASWTSSNDGTEITLITYVAPSLSGGGLATASSALDDVIDGLATDRGGSVERVVAVPMTDTVARSAFIKLPQGYLFASVFVKGTRVVTVLGAGPTNELPPLYSKVVNSLNID